MISHYYSEHQIFIDNVKKLCAKEFAPHIDSWEESGQFPDEVFTTLGQHGYLGLLIPEEYGGIDGDYKLCGAWCEAFGELPSMGLTIGVNMHSLVIASTLAKHGSETAKNEWLPRAVTGEAIGAYAFTEPGAGSDLASLATKAEKDGDKWRITGSKTFITNGARANFVLVLTRSGTRDDGRPEFTTFVVDTSLPGFSVTRTLDKLGWHSSDTAELSFDGVEVDDSCIIGARGKGWSLAMKNLNWERIMLALTTLGGTRACIRDVVQYTNDRKAFGHPIINIPAVRDMLVEMQTKFRICEALTYNALDKLYAGEPARCEVAIAKRLVCDLAVWIADRAIQLHGGYGYTNEFSAERWWRDIRLMPIGGGTSEIMGNVIGKARGVLQ